jgi:tetratricopeptide (TPR) repeat protein
MVIRETDSARMAKSKTREAVALATESRWEEAAEINRQLIEAQPKSLDAWNRLGKALLELGDIPGARDAFAESLRMDPTNVIALKNAGRLSEVGAPEVFPQAAALWGALAIDEDERTGTS